MITLKSGHDLVGMAEIAEMVEGGISTQAILNWRNRYPSFPKPIVVLRMGPIFYRPDIQKWLDKKEEKKNIRFDPVSGERIRK